MTAPTHDPSPCGPEPLPPQPAGLLPHVASLVAVRWISLALAVAAGVVVARSLGPTGKGVLAALGAAVALGAALAGLGLPSTAAYLYKRSGCPAGELVRASAVAWLVVLAPITVILSFEAEPVAAYLSEPTHGVWLQVSWVWLAYATLPGGLMAALLAVVLATDARHTRLFAVWTFGGSLLRIVLLALCLLVWKMGVAGVLVANVVVDGAIPLAVAVLWIARERAGFSLRCSRATLREMWRVGWQQHLISVLSNLFKRGDVLVVATVLDLRSAGLYAVAQTCYDLVLDIPRTAFWPVVARLPPSNDPTLGQAAARSTRLLFAGTLAVAAGSAVLVPLLIRLAYGSAFAQSATLFVLVLPGVLCRCTFLGASSYFTATGTPSRLVPALCIGATLSVGLPLLVADRFGLAAVCLSKVAGEAAMALAASLQFAASARTPWRATLWCRWQDMRDAWAAVRRRFVTTQPVGP